MNESQPNVAEFTVSELSAALKRTVEDNFGYVRVRGGSVVLLPGKLVALNIASA